MQKFGIFLAFLLIISCAEEMIKKPENLIPKNEMINILYDLALLNAGKNIDPGKLIDNNIETMPFIYKKYSIDSTQFVKSDMYYASKPLEYEALYTALEERLKQEKLSLEDIKKANKTKDSIKKVNASKKESGLKDSLP